jgi:hypothetical protein
MSQGCGKCPAKQEVKEAMGDKGCWLLVAGY